MDMGETPLDYALLRLSPNRTRCEMLISGGGQTETLSSGPTKSFLMQLRLAEPDDQTSQCGHLIKLEVPADQNQNETSAVWFNRATIERFSNFVNNPEIIERVNILDSEISQLEEAKNFQLGLYSQDDADEISSLPSVTDSSSCRESFKVSSQTESTDTSKKELLRAIDARLIILHKELGMAIARVDAAGFSVEHLENLLLFAQYFGATRLRDACVKYKKTRDRLGSKRSNENGSNRQAEEVENDELDGQSGSISVDAPAKQDVYMFRKQNSISSFGKLQQKKKEPEPCHSSGPPHGHSESFDNVNTENFNGKIVLDSEWKISQVTDEPNARTNDFMGRDESSWESKFQKKEVLNTAIHSPDRDRRLNMESASHENSNSYDAVTRRLSVQATVSLFENKQNNISDSNEGCINTVDSENQRLLSTGEMSSRRWSGESDMSMDLSLQQSTSNENEAHICLKNSVLQNTGMQLQLKVDEPVLFPRKFVENCNIELQLNEEIRKKARKLDAPSAGKFKSHSGPDALVMNINIEDSAGMALKEPTTEKEMDENSGMLKSSMDLNLQLLEEIIENRNKQVQLGDGCFSQGLRGKRYDLYMLKREAKLREEEPSKRLENEAKFKVMEKFLEQSKADIEEKRNPASHINVLTQTAKNGEEETDDLFKEHTGNKQSKKVTFKNSVLAAMVSPPSSKDLPRQTRPSKPIPCLTTAPISISSNKQRNQSSMSKNQLARSVPNFADLKKENTKPSPGKSGFGFTPVYQKSGSFSYAQHQNKKKSCNQSASPVQFNRSLSANSMNEKKRRNKDMMKSCASVSELKSLSGPRYERGILSPLKASKANKNGSSVESRPFLTKGRGPGVSIGPGTTETKVSPMKNMEYRSVDKQGSIFQSSNAIDAEKYSMGKHNRMNISYAQCPSDTTPYDCEEKGGFNTLDSSPLKIPPFSREVKYREKSGHLMGGSDSYVTRRVTANSPQQFQQVSPEGLKRFPNSGQQTMVSEAVNTEHQEDDFMRSRLFPYHTSYGFAGLQNEQIRVQSLRASVPAWPPNYELEEDHTSGVGSLPKAPRPCLAQTSFKSRGNDPKSGLSTMKYVGVRH